ncbi:MAG: chemotaxis protein CheA, partial [Chloroflexi bacterium]|nr:chemotaxis protein CheA [Chloroflexota bacterium]
MNPSIDVTAAELQVFLEETEEQIALLDRTIVDLEKNGSDPQLLQEIFRAAHTIKGSSAMIGHEPMAELTHAMEGLLDML